MIIIIFFDNHCYIETGEKNVIITEILFLFILFYKDKEVSITLMTFVELIIDEEILFLVFNKKKKTS